MLPYLTPATLAKQIPPRPRPHLHHNPFLTELFQRCRKCRQPSFERGSVGLHTGCRLLHRLPHLLPGGGCVGDDPGQPLAGGRHETVNLTDAAGLPDVLFNQRGGDVLPAPLHLGRHIVADATDRLGPGLQLGAVGGQCRLDRLGNLAAATPQAPLGAPIEAIVEPP